MIAPDTSGLKMHGVEELWERAFRLIRPASCLSLRGSTVDLRARFRGICKAGRDGGIGLQYQTQTGLPVSKFTPEPVWSAVLIQRFPLTQRFPSGTE